VEAGRDTKASLQCEAAAGRRAAFHQMFAIRSKGRSNEKGKVGRHKRFVRAAHWLVRAAQRVLEGYRSAPEGGRGSLKGKLFSGGKVKKAMAASRGVVSRTLQNGCTHSSILENVPIQRVHYVFYHTLKRREQQHQEAARAQTHRP
jgi:hypothetical protein